MDEPQEITITMPVPQARPVSLAPARTALVIVDMQNDHCKPNGPKEYVPRREAVIGPIRRLLERFRASGAPVLYVQSLRDADDPEFAVFGTRPYVLRGTPGAQIVDELTPRPSEPVIEKSSHDPFNGTDLERLLAERGIVPIEWSVIVVGLGLANCVGCAIAGFSVRNYWVAVPMDCTASRAWEDDVVHYQRWMGSAWSHNVTLTRSDLIELVAGAQSRAGALAQA
jgi:nicotinamidase-related amidase